MNIAPGSVVKLEFEASMDDETLERTAKPRLILVGRERDLPPGLEALLLGREAGESFTASVPDAFGAYDPAKRIEVPRAELPVPDAAPGSRFSAQGENGEALEARVVALDGDRATLELNHPRAGKTLDYTVHIHAVRPADAHELEHGHAHGEGGVHHEHHHD